MRLDRCKSSLLLAIAIPKVKFQQIKQEDGFPTAACKKCIQQIVQWEFFYETSHRSEDKLREAQRLKVEKENEFGAAENDSDTCSDGESDAITYKDEFLVLCVSFYLETKIGPEVVGFRKRGWIANSSSRIMYTDVIFAVKNSVILRNI